MWGPAVPFLAKLAHRPGDVCHVCDVGCGDGRMLQQLAAYGITGWGCDLSAAFVALAHGKGIAVQQCNAAEARLPKSSLIIALREVLAYIDTDARTPFDPVTAEAHTRLVPGGFFVFDLPGPATPSSQALREGPGRRC